MKTKLFNKLLAFTEPIHIQDIELPLLTKLFETWSIRVRYHSAARGCEPEVTARDSHRASDVFLCRESGR
jgi:hypothetical protein